MTESVCGYPGDRDEALVTYLYDESVADAAARAVFEAHLTTCVRCRDDLAALRGVRVQLGRWNPPEPSFTVPSPKSQVASRAWWREIPAWAQVAAALLFLGVSAGMANLDVRYDQSGLTVRTGWSRHAQSAAVVSGVAGSPTPVGAERGSAAAGAVAASAPWRADLDALERQLKTEFHAAQIGGAPTAVSAQSARAAADAEILRRVRALLDESEKRQQRELALRVAALIQDVNAQRQADLVKVDRALGTVENKLGVQVLKNQQQMNYYIRTSQRQ